MTRIVSALLAVTIGFVCMIGIVEVGAHADGSAGSGSAVTVPPFTGSATAGSATPTPTVITTTTTTTAPALAPSEKLHNPVDDPMAAIETVKAQKKQGWAVTILGCIVMLTAGLARGIQKWPNSKVFAWFAKNKAAVYIIAGLGVTGAAAFNALALGGTWVAAGYAGAGALFLMVHPGTTPAPTKEVA